MKDTKFYWNNNIDELRFAKWHTEKGEVYQDKKHTTASGADDLLTSLNSNGIDYYERAVFNIYDSNYALASMLYFNADKVGLLSQNTIHDQHVYDQARARLNNFDLTSL